MKKLFVGSTLLILSFAFLIVISSCKTSSSSSLDTALMYLLGVGAETTTNGTGGGCCTTCCSSCNQTNKTCTSTIAVVDSTNVPVQGAKVMVYAEKITSYDSDEYGEIIVPNLSNGSFIVTASKSGYKQKSQVQLIVRNNNCPVLEVVLVPLTTPVKLCGAMFVVKDKLVGRGVTYLGDAEIKINNKTYYTDLSTGSFVIPGLEAGKSYTYTVTKTGYDTISGTYSFLSTNQCPDNIIEMSATRCAVKLSVVYPDGKLVPDASITFILDGIGQLGAKTISGFVNLSNYMVSGIEHTYSITYQNGSDVYTASGILNFAVGAGCPFTSKITLVKQEPTVCDVTFKFQDNTFPSAPKLINDVTMMFNDGTSKTLITQNGIMVIQSLKKGQKYDYSIALDGYVPNPYASSYTVPTGTCSVDPVVISFTTPTCRVGYNPTDISTLSTIAGVNITVYRAGTNEIVANCTSVVNTDFSAVCDLGMLHQAVYDVVAVPPSTDIYSTKTWTQDYSIYCPRGPDVVRLNKTCGVNFVLLSRSCTISNEGQLELYQEGIFKAASDYTDTPWDQCPVQLLNNDPTVITKCCTYSIPAVPMSKVIYEMRIEDNVIQTGNTTLDLSTSCPQGAVVVGAAQEILKLLR